jgi:hypothetical protein
MSEKVKVYQVIFDDGTLEGCGSEDFLKSGNALTFKEEMHVKGFSAFISEKYVNELEMKYCKDVP